MTIKYCARGISSSFRTIQELVDLDHVTLTPVNNGNIILTNGSQYFLGTNYNSTTGGCTINFNYKFVDYLPELPLTVFDQIIPYDHVHEYNKVAFDSYRYYYDCELSDTRSETNTYAGFYANWHIGTLKWVDKSLGDLTNKILITDPSSGETEQQALFRIIFIYDQEISGYHPGDLSEPNNNFISNYSYTNGEHSITFYCTDNSWYTGVHSGRIQFRYLDGITKFRNLDATDLVSVPKGILTLQDTARTKMYIDWGGNLTFKAIRDKLVTVSSKEDLNDRCFYVLESLDNPPIKVRSYTIGSNMNVRNLPDINTSSVVGSFYQGQTVYGDDNDIYYDANYNSNSIIWQRCYDQEGNSRYFNLAYGSYTLLPNTYVKVPYSQVNPII